MDVEKEHPGTQNAASCADTSGPDPHVPSTSSGSEAGRIPTRIETPPPTQGWTTSDVLAAVTARNEVSSTALSMMRTSADLACAHLGMSVATCSVDALASLDEGFTTFLRDRHYQRSSLKSYWYYVRLIVKKAKQLGWRPCKVEQSSVVDHWNEILKRLSPAQRHDCLRFIKEAIRNDTSPLQFGDRDLAVWTDRSLHAGRTPQYVRESVRKFRYAICSVKSPFEFPLLSAPERRFTYGVRFETLPPTLRQEIDKVLQWKQARFAPGRSTRRNRDGRFRPVTAEYVSAFLCRLYGFALMRCKKDPTLQSPVTLRELITEDIIGAFMSWYLDTLQRRSNTLISCLGYLPGLFRHPDYAGTDLSWLVRLMCGIPADPESAIEEAKEKKWVDYTVLRLIPKKLRAARMASKEATTKETAEIVRDEFLIRWMMHFPWRQRNLRECLIGEGTNGGRVFKGPLPGSATMDVPGWAQQELRMNSDATFWQIHFREHDTKGKRPLRMIVPRNLVPYLEEYLREHRPALLHGTDPGTLFVNSRGAAFSRQQFTNLVKKITWHNSGKGVTPHLFRDIFALYWLKNFPAEIATVSKALWHKNIAFTIRKYGWAFDASHALARIEAHLETLGED